MIWQTALPREWKDGECYWFETLDGRQTIIQIRGEYAIALESEQISHLYDLRPLRWSGPIPMPEEPQSSSGHRRPR